MDNDILQKVLKSEPTISKEENLAFLHLLSFALYKIAYHDFDSNNNNMPDYSFYVSENDKNRVVKMIEDGVLPKVPKIDVGKRETKDIVYKLLK